uniref:Glycosyltransferase n=1 Tax=Oryza glumipatula TaxID=40148 RepID=A0A0E0AKA1_9ORYZ
MATPAPALVLLPEWGSGHLMSMLESCKRVLLAGAGGGREFSITLLVMRPPTDEAGSEVEAHVRREAASGLDIRFHRLPAVDPPADAAGVEEFIARYIHLHAPHVRDAVAGMGRPVAALVLDMFAAPMVDVARDLGVPSYVFMSSTGAMLALMLHLPVLHDRVAVEFHEVDREVDVPGLPPLPPASMPCPVVDKKSPNYTWFVRLGDRFMDATGIIANTADELEPGPLAAIADGRCVPGRAAPPVYPIGPVLSLGGNDKRDSSEPPHECIAWLDGQPPASVVFLCFGSMGWFEAAQVVEITAALERSGHRFLWVLRGPPPAAESGTGAPDGSEHPTDANLDELLPEGFLERTKGRGMVWPTWAPQKEILAHPAIGGFVTHGGWNSVLESLWHGVPMAPWPLYAEQHLNAFELVRDMGVAVPLGVDRERDNFVEAAELERAVRSLMDDASEEGKKAREKAAEMKAVCRSAVAAGGGSSHAALQRLSEALHQGAALPKK